ncbi:putative williams-beuren syndrome critical region protein [Operophtera brumata]|uniref:Putative williams-beuren syndrome critical region protein n=1 Tax=Operophtera brumata TaxID=104452 RepID=A0A0L7L3C8_OPEBR|nr:putative williams-beuren syndrome critical region protein [Operophtera brumata]
MFEHSVKVPRHFKVVANIVKQVSTEGGSVKTLLYDNKLRHFKTNVLYALITETIKHAADIDKIFAHCQLFLTENRLDPWLAKVLTTELLFGKKTLPGLSKPEQTILSFKEQFEKYVSDHQDDLKNEAMAESDEGPLVSEQSKRAALVMAQLFLYSVAMFTLPFVAFFGMRHILTDYYPLDQYMVTVWSVISAVVVVNTIIGVYAYRAYHEKEYDDDGNEIDQHAYNPQPTEPRYVRINTNLLTTSDAIRAFQDEGYHFIRCTSGSYEDYLGQIQKLTEYDFTQDYHIKTIFVFAPGTRWHDHELNGLLRSQLYRRNSARQTDISSGEVLKTRHERVPEGKTHNLQHMLPVPRGKRTSDHQRSEDLTSEVARMDFCVHNYIEETRLAKLTSLQEKFLKHAMNAFPKAKRIIYSTCSLYPEENERVITNVVKTSRAKWRVQDVKELLKGQWNNFGSGMYGSMGARCMYAKPDTDFTTGFFLAVLDRDEKDFAKAGRQEKNISETKKGDERKERKKKSSNDDDLKVADESGVDESNERKKNNVDVDESNKRKKNKVDGDESNKRKKNLNNDIEMEEITPKKKKKRDKTQEINLEAVMEESPKKKKDKRKLKDLLENLADLSVEESGADVPRKKKKKDKQQNIDVERPIEISQDISNDISEGADKKSKKKKSKVKDDEQMSEVVTEQKIKKKSKVAEVD